MCLKINNTNMQRIEQNGKCGITSIFRPIYWPTYIYMHAINFYIMKGFGNNKFIIIIIILTGHPYSELL